MANTLEKRIKAIHMHGGQPRVSEGGERTLDGIVHEPTALSAKSLSPVVSVLPPVAEGQRAMANAILRGSLFGVLSKKKSNGQQEVRKYEKKVVKATVRGLTLMVTGEQRDQTDLDVFLECLHRHKGLALGSLIKFKGGNFLSAIGRSQGSSDYKWLDGVLHRLATTSIELSDGRRYFQGPLIAKTYRDEDTHEYIIVFDPDIGVFFVDGTWTGLLVEERRALKGKQLALWLHGTYSTQDAPFAYKVETILNLCDSETKKIFHFRASLKKALSDLSVVTGWTCWIDEKTDLVHVVKTKAVRHE
ncbi:MULTISPECIES: plasmid replication initiator TrfA [Pseudomonas syringae group genomosp. 2]|uniref:Uncharacterized protein n=2 Tax=Pseudomonas amygdali pv. photiniae TaxID=251724 RepID=A0A0P9WTV0_PSEA0|nr:MULTISPECIES: plasmid replication initiator TrfA [Pseudomonas syringae group genomosp. 2]KPX54424.1 hypothetical protein ALO53_200002 [Pseudomonas amygdali pv. photiniae]RMN01656.1 hypothetical protein ALQ68_200000 [Pseudomonas savastanoi pv. glycinea]